jgi:predicted RNA-binding protein
MAYFIDLFSPETYEIFSQSDRSISGFRMRHSGIAQRVKPGDKFLCYLTKLSRWVGVLKVKSGPFNDSTPIFASENDPFVVRFKVEPLVWLPVEQAIPIHEDVVWNKLSFTKGVQKNSSIWTGKVRGSLVQLSDEDGGYIESILFQQINQGVAYSYNEEDFKKFASHRVKRIDKDVTVTVPEDTENEQEHTGEEPRDVRESHKIQALVARIGSQMDMRVWIPRSDRSQIIAECRDDSIDFLDRLPLNYDDVTLKTIEQIDVLWLKGRSIKRAFEIEHTTSVYSGILRMADLLALQPNMDIRLHIVAPQVRRAKVFQELRRPVFSLLDRGPLYESCTFLSYDSIHEIAELPHLAHLSDSVLNEYEEEAEE